MVISFALLLFMLYPTLRVALKRIKLALRLKNACRLSGAVLRPTHFFWFFGTNSGRHCDFYVETTDTVFSVKLFAVRRRLSEMYVGLDGKYSLEYYFYLLSPGAQIRVRIRKTRTRDFVNCDFLYRYPKDAQVKYNIPVRLFCPVCTELKKEVRKGKYELMLTGELLNGFYFINSTRFCDKLKEGELKI